MLDLLERIGLDLDFQAGIPLTSPLDGCGYWVGLFVLESREVVVLNEDHIRQPQAMVLTAAAGDGVFLEAPPAGSRFARVENPAGGVFDRLDELCRECGHPRKTLDKIERYPFGAKERPG